MGIFFIGSLMKWNTYRGMEILSQINSAIDPTGFTFHLEIHSKICRSACSSSKG